MCSFEEVLTANFDIRLWSVILYIFYLIIANKLKTNKNIMKVKMFSISLHKSNEF